MRISLELPDRIDEAKARELVAQVEQALRDWPDVRLRVDAVSLDLARMTQTLFVGDLGFSDAHWGAVAGAALEEAAEAATALRDSPGVSRLRLRIQNARLALGMNEPDPGAAA